MTATSQEQKMWILCVVFITVTAEETPCPRGGQIQLGSWRCYWLSEVTYSWSEGQDSCRRTPGGDLVSAESLQLQNFIRYSFPRGNTEWVWLKGTRGGASEQVGVVPDVRPSRWVEGVDGQEVCEQMDLKTPGHRRNAHCAGRYLSLCERDVTDSLPPENIYLVGPVLMTGVYTQTQTHTIAKVPDTGRLRVEVQVFPGMWFSHAGRLISVELVVQPSPVSSLARIQILRPYCSPNHHLVPPGCSSLVNPFSCCSEVPLCNTTGGCSMGRYWCHLSESCVHTTSPCSPYDSSARHPGFALPPRYTAIPPFYHQVADLPVRLNPGSELETLRLPLPDGAIMVYPDDIVAIQHTRDNGTFLHCLNSEASLSSSWRQSYMSLEGAPWGGWWEGGSLPQDIRWVDGMVCNLRMLYINNLQGGLVFDDFTHGAIKSDPTEFGLQVIQPIPDEKNQIHIQINVPTLILVTVVSGQKSKSTWSAPVLQTGVPFFQFCPEEVAQSCPGCRRDISHDAWFSSVSLVLTSVGVEMLNISVMDAVGSQSVSLGVCGYEAVTGLSVQPHGCLRMIIETPQTLLASVRSGSSVKFKWVIDNLEEFAHEGQSYSVMFNKPAEHKLKLTASNPVSSQSHQILLTADELTPLLEPEFVLDRNVVAVESAHLYTVSVKVDISLPVTFRWDFGDGSSEVIHTHAALCQDMGWLKKREERQLYIQDTVNYTYSIPDDYTLHIGVSNQYDSNDASVRMSVRPQLKRLLVSSSSLVLPVKEALLLEASSEPSSYGVIHTWDFGDGSEVIQDTHSNVVHTFASAGVYKITVCANNTLMVLTSWLTVEVMESISGLTVSCSRSSEVNSPVDFRAEVATGNNPIWNFDFGDTCCEKNLTDGSIYHIYKLPGYYTVNITVWNHVSRAQQFVSVEVYRLSVSGVLPRECLMSGKDVELTALVNGKINNLSFHWLLGDGSPLILARGQSTLVHKFQNQGVFHVSLTVLSSVSSTSYNTTICIETAIADMTVQASQEVVAVREEVCFSVLVSPEEMTGYDLAWQSSRYGVITRTENLHRCFIFKYEGVEEVLVTASNKVSNQTVKVSVSILNPVGQLSVAHEGQADTLMLNTLASFWVVSCSGSNVSVLWDFGDSSPVVEQELNVSHVFTSTGQFTITTTAFNAVSRHSVTLKVNVLLPVSDFSLHTDQPYAVVGEEALISANSSVISGTNFSWTVDGVASSKQGTYQFRFTFPKAGVYRVRVMAQNLVSRKQASILIEVFERIEGLQIECQSLTNVKYVPAEEELQFIASVTKGSNVTYHWFATKSGMNHQIIDEGPTLHVFSETPGGISVHVTASNKLGNSSSSASLVAVQRVEGAHITTQSSYEILGKVVNISVSVTSGSDLQYLWYVKSNLPPLRTHEPFLFHTFTSCGYCFVKVSVLNVLGNSNATKEFNIQEEIQDVDFDIEGKTHPFYITTTDIVAFHGLVLKGSDPHWNWNVRGASTQLSNITQPSFLYSFPYAGIYQVSLNVSNGINWQIVSHSITVQDAIRDLKLNISKSSFCTGEPASFIATVSSGSNRSFTLTFKNRDWIHSQDSLDGLFITSSLPAGTYVVKVKAWNGVSSAEVSSRFLVTHNIYGLRFLNRCSAALEALKGIKFKAEIQNELPVNYTWVFHMVSLKPTWLIGQEVIFTPPDSGSLSISVMASNGICSKTLNYTATVQRPVKNVTLVCLSERIFVGHTVMFSAKVNTLSNLMFLWDFGDSSEAQMTDLNTVNHTYYTPGRYGVVVKVLNNVSRVTTQLDMDVEELLCSSPRASLVQIQSTIFRSRPSVFEASVEMNCTAYKTMYLWEILRESNCSNASSKISFSGRVDPTSPILSLPKHSLQTGQYCLVLTISLKGTHLCAQREASITVVHSPLVAVIKGGTHRMWSSLAYLNLDGSDSQDPDTEPGVEDTLQYEWTMTTLNSTERYFLQQPTGNRSSLTLPSSQLHHGTVYVFTLTVFKTGRMPVSVNQTVTVCEAPVLPVIVECVSCSVMSSTYRMSHTNPIILSGHCPQCDDQAQYTWGAEDQAGMTIKLDRVTTSTGIHYSNLVLRSGYLQLSHSYVFTLNVSQHDQRRWGSASVTIQAYNPPHGGSCDLSPESDVHLLDSRVIYNCSGWKDGENGSSQLIYTLQVAPCRFVGMMCPLLTLYRGTRSTFSSLVPMGSPGQERDVTVITVILLVEDHLGSKVTALNRSLTVRNPLVEETAGQWLRNKSQTELWALVQHNNPQEIISYSIALTSQLNRLIGPTFRELMDRREIRRNVTQALVSLPVSSLVDVDQISSALSESTAVPEELRCETCQGQVLEAVGKMIQIIEEQMTPVAPLAVETGRNILNIIGSTLAAVSVGVSGSSSDPDSFSSLQSASTITLSALGHAGALMRSLMGSHVYGMAPLSLSGPYINMLGFHGDPSNLLCTHQSEQNQIFLSQSSSTNERTSSLPCEFQIPVSLTAHLRSRKSEVVQVLFGMDAGTVANPLFTAAHPPISTNLVAMELTTPEGQPIHVEDLDLEQAIRVTLPNRYPVELNDGVGWEVGNGSCLTVTLSNDETLNLTVNPLDELHENAGLYISFNFSLDPGGTPVSRLHVRIEVSSTVPGTNVSEDFLVREWTLALSALNTSMVESIFLSPLLNGTDGSLIINLSSSLMDGNPARVSVCVFSSLCQYFSMEERRWSSEGLRPLEGSTLHAAHCLTQHLTMFGASLFVHPGAVVLLPPTGGPMRNLMVVIVCAVLVLIHLLLGLITHKMDHLDSLRLSQVPLCGRPGLFHYRVLVKTGWRRGAGTTAHVGISLYGVNKSGSRHLQGDGAFQRGGLDQFHLETDESLGEVWKIRIWHDNTGLDPSWYLQHVVVLDPQTDHMFFFLLEDWLSVENQTNGTVEKEVLASCPEELSQFGRVFISQLMFGMLEHHLWVSLWERPTHSRFSRGQRVACSALMLHLYLALGALWYGAVGLEGQSGPVSARMLVTLETVAVGVTVAVLAFPLQCLLCFLFRKTPHQVAVCISTPPSPVCHSVEMDVYLGQSELSKNTLLFLSDSCSSLRASHSSLQESKVVDSSILDFWAASGLAPQTDVAHQDEGMRTWLSCDSLLSLSGGHMTPEPDICRSPALGPIRQLKRKKALIQHRLASPFSTGSSAALLSSLSMETPSKDTSGPHQYPAVQDLQVSTMKTNPVHAPKNNLTTLLTLSEEDLLMSIAAAAEETPVKTYSNSDSGRDSPRASSSLSDTCHSCSSQTGQSDYRSHYGAEIQKPNLESCTSLYGPGIRNCPSVDSVASTFLTFPSADSTRSSSTTRIGVARGKPDWRLPPWALGVIYPLMALLLGVCLAVVEIYGSFLSRSVVLMWMVSTLSAFLSSALLLEPLRVCVQAFISTVLWRPVDQEVEDQLALETTVVRTFGDHGRKVRPPCGYGLLQAKEEARKVRALRSLMRHCVCQLLFLLLLLMVNYQDSVEQRQGRMLHSAVKRHLYRAPQGVPNLNSLRDWSDVERWILHTLVPHLHQNPGLRLVGLPRLQERQTLSPPADTLLGDNVVKTQQLLTDLHMADWRKKQFRNIWIDFTHHHRESGLFVCVSIQLEWVQTQRITPSLSIHPLLIRSSVSGLDLHITLTVLLLMSFLLILFGELWSLATERAQYLRHCKHWFQLLLASLTLATAILQICFLIESTSCVSKLQSHPDSFIHLHSAASLAQRSTECAAVLLTLLVLKLLGTLRFVRRWVVVGRVLQRAWRELWALTVFLLMLLLLCIHLGNVLFSRSVEGFLSLRHSSISVLSILSGRMALQRLCSVHPYLGPLYGLLLMGGGVWLLARLCGAVLIHTYRAVQAEMYRPTIEPQDYEMVEFFIKRLKLWLGLTKAKEFRHRVKFEGMEIPPSRSSQESFLSSTPPSLPSSYSPSLFSTFSSPRPPSSSLSVRSEDSSLSESRFDVQPYLDHLLPCVSALLSRFDQVNQTIEDIHHLEVKLEEAEARRRKIWISNKNKDSTKPNDLEGEGRKPRDIRQRRTSRLYSKPRVSLPSSFSFTPPTLNLPPTSISRFPRTRSTHSESEYSSFHSQASSSNQTSEAAKPTSGLKYPYPGSPGLDRFPRRRAWHSGSSHSADAAQRILLTQGGLASWGSGESFAFTKGRPRTEEGDRRTISDRVPVKRKAWISEGSETEQD